MERKLINRLLHSAASLNIGKLGATEDLIRELNDQLNKKKVVKVRILKSVENVEETLKQLEQQSNGKITKKVGNSVIFIQSD